MNSNATFQYRLRLFRRRMPVFYSLLDEYATFVAIFTKVFWQHRDNYEVLFCFCAPLRNLINVATFSNCEIRDNQVDLRGLLP